MSSPRVTILTVNFNSLHCCELAFESLHRHHHAFDYRLHVTDTGSTDGAKEYLQARADQLVQAELMERHVGCHLTRMAREVDTEYLFTMDTDVEFTGPIVERMLREMDADPEALCLAPTPTCAMGTARLGYLPKELQGQERMDHCGTLWRTGKLQPLLRWVSMTPYVAYHEGWFFDTCAMLYHVAMAAGTKVRREPWVWRQFRHYGGCSKLWHPGADDEYRALAAERYEVVKARLTALRAGTV
jgi:hypothetical protein